MGWCVSRLLAHSEDSTHLHLRRREGRNDPCSQQCCSSLHAGSDFNHHFLSSLSHSISLSLQIESCYMTLNLKVSLPLWISFIFNHPPPPPDTHTHTCHKHVTPWNLRARDETVHFHESHSSFNPASVHHTLMSLFSARFLWHTVTSQLRFRVEPRDILVVTGEHVLCCGRFNGL